MPSESPGLRGRVVGVAEIETVARYPPGIGESTLTFIHTESFQLQLERCQLRMLRRSEQPTAVVPETIGEQVHW